MLSKIGECWRRAVADLRAGFAAREREYNRLRALGHEPTDAQMDKVGNVEAMLDRVGDATLAIWRSGAKTWADVALFAELARYWVWNPDDQDLERRFREYLEPKEDGLDYQSLAQLVNATSRSQAIDTSRSCPQRTPRTIASGGA